MMGDMMDGDMIFAVLREVDSNIIDENQEKLWKQALKKSGIQQTEKIIYSKNPNFVMAFQIPYHFGKQQRFSVALIAQQTPDKTDQKELAEKAVRNGDKINVLQNNEGSGLGQTEGQSHIDEQTLSVIGYATFELSDLMVSKSKILNRSLFDTAGKKTGAVIQFKASEDIKMNSKMEIIFYASSLAPNDVKRPLNPFLVVSRQNDDGSWTPSYRTEVKFNTRELSWKVVRMTVGQFNNGDLNCPIQLEIKNWDENGVDELIGCHITSTQKLIVHYEENIAIPIQSSAEDLMGWLYIHRFETHEQPGLLDFLHGGVELNYMVAIDYNRSNGDTDNPNSLHSYQPKGVPTVYEQVMHGMSQILENYLGGEDAGVRVWGFGGNPNTEHPLNEQLFEVADCVGVNKVVAAYRESLANVSFGETRKFSTVIQRAIETVEASDKGGYHILLIVTNGQAISDEELLESIIQASKQPLSIIIVGVGVGDFGDLTMFNPENQRTLQYNDEHATRDVIQFEKCSDYSHDIDKLLEKVLGEIPRQIMEYIPESAIPQEQAPYTISGPVAQIPPRNSFAYS
eukprot:TRINITY_DN5213_c0_g1_i10.p1 TRINITY_DN5213_c0_g1~~TRINITY_DN5213_c0_g1_i10.p1  ORF type:complete len:569 (-),score=86.16 TRINITY_DN5213_c0_g1_i10:57-1763(-)